MRTFHFYYELVVFVLAWALNWLVLYLIIYRTPKTFKGYSRMIAMNTVIDLIYSLTDVVTMEVG